MVTIYVDNQPYRVKDGQNLLDACLSAGLDIPYFCWHPAMGSVGACRQCAVKLFTDSQDTRGRIVLACMTPVADGISISIRDPEAATFRAAVMGWLMSNHPHDCPVCDEGGECHLQDMSVMTGHTYRAYRFTKRTFNNQHFGPFIHHEMNRCIQCFRCVRFYRDLAGGRDLVALGSRNRTYFGRFKDGRLESPFSGNLVEVCPTGVFTDGSMKPHPARKWDLQSTPSICPHCSLGCNILLGERYGTIRRVLNRYNSQVNGYFLCDRGRYGYAYNHSNRRIRAPAVRDQAMTTARPSSVEKALSQFAKLCGHRSRLVGIGSPRASLEANYALRALVGPERFSNGMSHTESSLVTLALAAFQQGPARSPSLAETAMADAVLILGEDVINTAPMLALSLRQAARNPYLQAARKANIPTWDDNCTRLMQQSEQGPLAVATPIPTWLDPLASVIYRAAPDDIARFGFAIAHLLDPRAPAVDGLSKELSELIVKTARLLELADRPLVVSGTACASKAVIQAAANLAWALCRNGRKADLCLVPPAANSLGVSMLSDMSIESVADLLRNGSADTLVILENDLFRRLEEHDAERLCSRAKHIVLIDHLAHRGASSAKVVLSAASLAESTGTLVNNEGRAQRFFKALDPGNQVRPSWQWLRDVLVLTGDLRASTWSCPDDITSAMSAELPWLAPVLQAAPLAGFRKEGRKIPRQSQRYTGRTAMYAHIQVSEPRLPEDRESALSFSMEGYHGRSPATLVTRYWAPGWNSVQALCKLRTEHEDLANNDEAGIRLIEAPLQSSKVFFTGVPQAFSPRPSAYLAVCPHHVFGSEELSSLSTPIAELAPQPSLSMNPQDAAVSGIKPGQLVKVVLENRSLALEVTLQAGLARGMVVMPIGSMVSSRPAWINIQPLS